MNVKVARVSEKCHAELAEASWQNSSLRQLFSKMLQETKNDFLYSLTLYFVFFAMARFLTQKEKSIISLLLTGSEYATKFLPLFDQFQVENLNDGHMGSIRFENSKSDRRYGGDIAEIELKDEDGIPVIITLIIDQYDQLYDLDIWKVDFSSTKNLVLPNT